MFWVTLGFIWLFSGAGTVGGVGIYPSENAAYLGWYLFMWGLFTLFMFFATLRLNRAVQFVFGSLTILFGLLALGHWVSGDAADTILKIAGWEGIICGSSAIYLAMAEVINEYYGKVVLPIGPVH